MALIIGVSGASGSGKSAFCSALAGVLSAGGRSAVIIALDRFYKKDLPRMISPADGAEYPDWNCPESIDDQAARSALNRALTQGHDIVILDGAFLFCLPALEEKLNYRIFIDASIETRLYRRICRNLRRSGQTAERIGEYYLKCARCQEAKFSLPSGARAELTVDNEYSFAEGLSRAAWEIEKLISCGRDAGCRCSV